MSENSQLHLLKCACSECYYNQNLMVSNSPQVERSVDFAKIIIDLKYISSESQLMGGLFPVGRLPLQKKLLILHLYFRSLESNRSIYSVLVILEILLILRYYILEVYLKYALSILEVYFKYTLELYFQYILLEVYLTLVRAKKISLRQRVD